MKSTLSARTLRALAVFGLSVPRARSSFALGPEPAARSAAARSLRALRSNNWARAILLAGPSGAGKSTAMRLVARALRRARSTRKPSRIVTVNPGGLRRECRPPIDLIGAPLAQALGLLARAGLSDATLLARPAKHLSDGQRWRLALALALQRAAIARPPTIILADEFCTGLDLPTAIGVAHCALTRCASRKNVVLLAATSREDLIDAVRSMPTWLVIDIGSA